jgi:transposase
MSTNRRKQQARQRGARQRAERQARRERAAELFAQGRSQAEVARELEVSRQSAGRWHAGWQAAGTTALQSRGPTGRPPKIPDSALEAIEQARLEGALAHGFPTNVWTLDRIAVVIQGLTGVQLSTPSVWRLLRNRLGWTVQRPQRQAKERDQEAIQHWVAQEWPRIQKGARRIGLDRLLRRIRHLADPTGTAHLVTTQPHPDPASPDGLEAGLHGRRPRLPPRRHQSPVVLSPPGRQLCHRQPD